MFSTIEILVKGKKMNHTAVAYYRTSSATNVGSDKDSLNRQREAVTNYAEANGIKIVREFYDAAVSGADPLEEREGFSDLMAYIASNGARTILVENASRFARDLTVQLVGHSTLKKLNYELICVDAPNHFIEDTPTAEMVRSVLGAIAQFEKAQLVSKLKVARQRKREANGKCEGRKSYLELNPEMVREAKRLRRKNPKSGKQRSLRKIASELFEMGHMTATGRPYNASQIRDMVTR